MNGFDGGGGASVATTCLPNFGGAGGGSTTFSSTNPCADLNPNTKNAVVDIVNPNPNTTTDSALITSIGDPILGANGSIANPGTNITGSHLVNKFDPGVSNSNQLSPKPGATTSARTSVVKTSIVQPSMAGKLILFSRNTFVSSTCNTVKNAAPTSSFVFGISTLVLLPSPPRYDSTLLLLYSSVKDDGVVKSDDVMSTSNLFVECFVDGEERYPTLLRGVKVDASMHAGSNAKK